MKKFRNIFLFITILFCNTFVFANEKCSEERKQWVEFYKQNFANDFGKVNFSSDPCLIDIINQEDKNKVEVDNAVKNIFSDIKSDNGINWVPEYFELNAKPDYLYGVQYYQIKNYETAALFFEDFLEANPQDRLTPKAQFLYGETFRLTEDYIEAAYQYLDVYEKFNKNEFVPLSLLRLGEMMIKIDYKDKGCEILNHFQYEFYNIEDEIFLESEDLMKKYQCTKVVITDGEIMLVDAIKKAISMATPQAS